MLQNINREYDPRTGRYRQFDPTGLDDGPNGYAYVGGNPLTYTDPYGLWALGDPLPQGVMDFSAGMGDVMLFGQGQRLRDLFDVDGGIDKCSGEYSAGEWAGVAASLATGFAGGLKAAGAKGAGMEFSHALPARMFRPSSKSYSPTLDKYFGWAERTPLNGNYVPPMRHYKHDPFRYPKGWRDFGEKWSPFWQKMDRVPNVYTGTAAGAAYGAGGAAMAGCTCKK